MNLSNTCCSFSDAVLLFRGKFYDEIMGSLILSFCGSIPRQWNNLIVDNGALEIAFRSEYC